MTCTSHFASVLQAAVQGEAASITFAPQALTEGAVPGTVGGMFSVAGRTDVVFRLATGWDNLGTWDVTPEGELITGAYACRARAYPLQVVGAVAGVDAFVWQGEVTPLAVDNPGGGLLSNPRSASATPVTLTAFAPIHQAFDHLIVDNSNPANEARASIDATFGDSALMHIDVQHMPDLNGRFPVYPLVAASTAVKASYSIRFLFDNGAGSTTHLDVVYAVAGGDLTSMFPGHVGAADFLNPAGQTLDANGNITRSVGPDGTVWTGSMPQAAGGGAHLTGTESLSTTKAGLADLHPAAAPAAPLTQAFTVLMAIKTSGVGSLFGWECQNRAQGYAIEASLDAGVLKAAYVSFDAVPTNRWAVAALVFDGATLASSVQSSALAHGVNPNNGFYGPTRGSDSFKLGALYAGAGWDVTFAKLHIWNRALSADELSQASQTLALEVNAGAQSQAVFDPSRHVGDRLRMDFDRDNLDALLASGAIQDRLLTVQSSVNMSAQDAYRESGAYVRRSFAPGRPYAENLRISKWGLENVCGLMSPKLAKLVGLQAGPGLSGHAVGVMLDGCRYEHVSSTWTTEGAFSIPTEGGFVEWRVRFDRGRATWPQLWLYALYDGTQREPDLLECIGNDVPVSTMHFKDGSSAGVTFYTVPDCTPDTGDWVLLTIELDPVANAVNRYVNRKLVISSPLYVAGDDNQDLRATYFVLTSGAVPVESDYGSGSRHGPDATTVWPKRVQTDYLMMGHLAASASTGSGGSGGSGGTGSTGGSGGSGGGASTTFAQLFTPVLNMPGGDGVQMGNDLYGGESGVIAYDQVPIAGGGDLVQAAFTTTALRDGDQVERGWGGPVTFHLAYEFPAGSGVLYPALWGGQPSITLADNSVSALHDALHIPGLSSAAAGTPLGVQTKAVGTAYEMDYACKRRTAVGRKLIWASGVGPDILSVDRSTWTSTGDLPMPTLIVAQMSVPQSAEVYIGDSITVDLAHSADALGVCGFAQEVDAAHGVLKLAATGNNLARQVGAFTSRLALLALIPNARINVHINYGENDLGDSSHGPAIAANLTTLIGRITAAQPRAHCYPMTISPNTNSGAALDETDRLSANASIRAGLAGATAYYDWADWSETARNSGVWGKLADGTVKSSDGVHPDWFTATVRADLLLARRAWRAGVVI